MRSDQKQREDLGPVQGRMVWWPRGRRGAQSGVSSEPSGRPGPAMGWSPLGPMERDFGGRQEGGPRQSCPRPRRPAGGTGRSGPPPRPAHFPPAPESTAGSPPSAHLSTPPFAFPTAPETSTHLPSVFLSARLPTTSHPGSRRAGRLSGAAGECARVPGHLPPCWRPLPCWCPSPPPTKRAFSRGGDPPRESLSVQVRCSPAVCPFVQLLYSALSARDQASSKEQVTPVAGELHRRRPSGPPLWPGPFPARPGEGSCACVLWACVWRVSVCARVMCVWYARACTRCVSPVSVCVYMMHVLCVCVHVCMCACV